MKLKLQSLLLASLFSVVPAANADIFIGVKGGLIDSTASGTTFGTATSVQLGYEFLDMGLVDFAVELEKNTSVSDIDAGSVDLSFDSTGIFASARTIGPIYAMGRYGIVDTEINGNKEDGTAIGVGFGFSAGLRWEFEYTTYDIDNSEKIKYLTVGVHF